MDIAGSTALVTGANRGIGAAFTRELLARGAAKVYAAVRDTATVNDPRLIAIRLDVTDSASIAEAARVAQDVTLLVNNAGVAAGAPAELEVNLLGPVAVTRAFAPILAANGGGAVVNMLSQATDSLRLNLREQGTLVTAVRAGHVDTDMTARIDAPKLAPSAVAAAALDGVEADADDVLVVANPLPHPLLNKESTMTTAEFVKTIIDSAAPGDGTIAMKLEVVRIPVSDPERAKRFYRSLGWRLDADFHFSENERAIQFTPLGSDASIQFDIGGTGAVTNFLVVTDIEAAREDLVARGVGVSEVFHREGDDAQVPGPAPDHLDYGSFAAFTDPDGNVWLLQEINNRLPGRAAGKTTYGSVEELAQAMQRAEAAHGEYEATLGHRDDEWPAWYAAYMVREQAGEEVGA